MNKIDLIGHKFNRLTVICRSEKKSKANIIWNCECDCGNFIDVASLKLRSNQTKSCGCLKRELISKVNKTHGMSNKTPTYKTWKEMRSRCNSPSNDKFKWYGGRGIKVCQEWGTFEQFLIDMGERPKGMTIDRINNDGDYTPSNCVWLSPLDQTRKQSKNKLSLELASLLRFDRESKMTYRELGVKYGVSATTAHRCFHHKTWN